MLSILTQRPCMQVQTILCAVVTMAILPFSSAHCQPASAPTPPHVQAPESITAAAKALQSPSFMSLRESVARQSTAIANAASVEPVGYNRELIKSGVVERQAHAMAESNRTAERGTGPEQIRLAQLSLPSMEQFASDLKFGKFVTVSSKGPEIVTLIRSLGMRGNKEQIDILKKIQQLSLQGFPEAQNFVGNILEYGLFGNAKDVPKASTYYVLAAKQRYQPAIFNLALMNYFGRIPGANAVEAERLFYQAYAIGPESSARVCGMAAYAEYRLAKPAESMRYAQNCHSPLANIPNAAYSPSMTVPERIKLFRDSIVAGPNDGFGLLAQLGKSVPNDPQFLSCKFQIMNRIQFTPIPANLRDTARDCYFSAVAGANSAEGRARAEISITSISGFVATELPALAQQRKTNYFHHHYSVPFLPFTQADVELFDAIYPKGNP